MTPMRPPPEIAERRKAELARLYARRDMTVAAPLKLDLEPLALQTVPRGTSARSTKPASFLTRMRRLFA